MSKSTIPSVATFVAPPGEKFTLDIAGRALAAAGVTSFRSQWLDEGAALDMLFESTEKPSRTLGPRIEAALHSYPIDVIVQPLAFRRKALLVADMDSTMIAQECVDELAETIGQREKVAKLTAAAMRGEVDFHAALTARVALFEGVPVGAVQNIVDRITPNPGARALVATMRARGAHAVLVSGGFTLFADLVGARLGFNEVFANRLEIAQGRLTGRIVPPIQGADAKGEILTKLCHTRGVSPESTLAVGDGANDLVMLSLAGLGVAYRAKPHVAASAACRIESADLTALLFAQGFTRDSFVEN
ncbi:MAG: phosphoserine phosphatase SerB [Methylocystis sp.]